MIFVVRILSDVWNSGSAPSRPESFPDPVPVHPVERLGEEIKDRELRDLFVSVAAKNLMLRSR
jgi:hypothetical protein